MQHYDGLVREPATLVSTIDRQCVFWLDLMPEQNRRRVNFAVLLANCWPTRGCNDTCFDSESNCIGVRACRGRWCTCLRRRARPAGGQACSRCRRCNDERSTGASPSQRCCACGERSSASARNNPGLDRDRSDRGQSRGHCSRTCRTAGARCQGSIFTLLRHCPHRRRWRCGHRRTGRPGRDCRAVARRRAP